MELHQQQEEGPDQGDDVEYLLDEIHRTVGPHAWDLVEEAVQRLVALYGSALGRVLGHARASTVGPTYDQRLINDDLVVSLLLLHGLHPRSIEERIRGAVRSLGASMPPVEIAAIDPDGSLHLRVLGAIPGSVADRILAEQALRRRIVEAAPEITRIHVAGPGAPPAAAGALQIRLRPPRQS
jgi:hypothetical protein